MRDIPYIRFVVAPVIFIFSLGFSMEGLLITNAPPKNKISFGFRYDAPSDFYTENSNFNSITYPLPTFSFFYSRLFKNKSEITFGILYSGTRDAHTNIIDFAPYSSYQNEKIDQTTHYLDFAFEFKRMFMNFPFRPYVGVSIDVLSMRIISKNNFTQWLTTNKSDLSMYPYLFEPVNDVGTDLTGLMLKKIELCAGIVIYFTSRFSVDFSFGFLKLSKNGYDGYSQQEYRGLVILAWELKTISFSTPSFMNAKIGISF